MERISFKLAKTSLRLRNQANPRSGSQLLLNLGEEDLLLFMSTGTWLYLTIHFQMCWDNSNLWLGYLINQIRRTFALVIFWLDFILVSSERSVVIKKCVSYMTIGATHLGSIWWVEQTTLECLELSESSILSLYGIKEAYRGTL